MNRIEGRRILITGATAGIGLACAPSFAESGAHLALHSVDQRNAHLFNRTMPA
jgi:NAD(P)-dependent dehydrogenase (short-subunit alcohol dehydrogenase family)